MKTILTTLAAALLAISGSASAEFIETTEISQIGAYQAATTHYVWLSTGISAECAAQGTNSVLAFDEAQPGGKGLLAILTSALLNKRKVSVRTSGCNIVEVYLK